MPGLVTGDGSPTAQIADVDRQITAIRRDLLRRHPIKDRLSAHEYQAAWDACPDLLAASQALWRKRGVLQLERDRIAADRADAEARREARRRQPSKCPCCKGSGYAPQVSA